MVAFLVLLVLSVLGYLVFRLEGAIRLVGELLERGGTVSWSGPLVVPPPAAPGASVFGPAVAEPEEAALVDRVRESLVVEFGLSPDEAQREAESVARQIDLRSSL